MFERFTDRARKVMQLANQEAQFFNHEYIGTEHILLGLVKEGSGVAANVLHNLYVDLHKIRKEVEKIVQAGPEPVLTGKLPHTPRAKKVIEFAIMEARSLNHNYVGTEHLLLGLLREEEGVAAQVLMNLGVSLERVHNETLALLGHGTATVASDAHAEKFPAQALLEAKEEARRLNQGVVHTGHLLAGLIDNCGDIPDRVLQGLGATAERVRKGLAELAFELPGWQSSSGATYSESLCNVIRASTDIAHSMSAAGETQPEGFYQQIEKEIEQLNEEKEEAIVRHEFEKAAELRDRADELKRKLKSAGQVAGPAHLLLAMLADRTCAAVRILQNLGLHPEQVRTEVLKALQSGQP